ncbi:hypothetical protein L7F22_018224 [Adiantum nelumboides]|nr:hypothetical protein [Adiantum nelumboides]
MSNLSNILATLATRRRALVDDRYTRTQGLYQHRDVDSCKLRRLILMGSWHHASQVLRIQAWSCVLVLHWLSP